MPTPYETIYQYVLDDVKRPDLEEEINRRIQRALLYFHRKDMWKRDLIEQTYVFENSVSAAPVQSAAGADSLFMTSMNAVGNTLFIQQVNINYLTRYRFTQYIRKYSVYDAFGVPIIDPVTGALGTVANGDFTERSPDRMFDGYGGDTNDVMYLSGDMINLRSSTPLPQVYIGYFSDPILEPVAVIGSWIASKYPNLIAARVKGQIFSDIGKDEEKKGAKLEENEEMISLYSNNVRLAMA